MAQVNFSRALIFCLLFYQEKSRPCWRQKVIIGKTISHYTITEKLGEGGMGEVYLADDLKLERQVAIKFLPEHLTKDKENVERFEREAKAAAALNHPNIVTIYDVIEEEDQICIVMEYVDGKSLREILNTPLRPPLIG